MICISSMILWMNNNTNLREGNRILTTPLIITILIAHGPSNLLMFIIVHPQDIQKKLILKRNKWNSIIIIISANILNLVEKCINQFGNIYIIWECKIKNRFNKLINSNNLRSIPNALFSQWSEKIVDIVFLLLQIFWKETIFGKKISYKKL